MPDEINNPEANEDGIIEIVNDSLDVNQLTNLFQGAIEFGDEEPGPEEGQDGDITFRYINGKGMFLFVRHQGQWYSRLFRDDVQTLEDEIIQNNITVVETTHEVENFHITGTLTFGSSTTANFANATISNLNHSSLADVTNAGLHTRYLQVAEGTTETGGTTIVNNSGTSNDTVAVKPDGNTITVADAGIKINLNNANTWTIGQTFNEGLSIADTKKIIVGASGSDPANTYVSTPGLISPLSTPVITVGSTTQLKVAQTTQATNKDPGALIVEGGVGIEKNLHVGGDLAVGGSASLGLNDVQDTTVTIDTSNAEAFLVRQNSDAGDTLTVDTSGLKVTIGADASGDYTDLVTFGDLRFKYDDIGNQGRIIFSTNPADSTLDNSGHPQIFASDNLEGTAHDENSLVTSASHTKIYTSNLHVLAAQASDTGQVTDSWTSETFIAELEGRVKINGGNCDDVDLDAASGHLILGIETGNHIALDANEIQSKSNATTATILHLNVLGGAVKFGDTSDLLNASYTSGLFDGDGWSIYKDSNNEYNFEIDNLWVRNGMYVHELVINQVRATNGSMVVTSAATCTAASGTFTAGGTLTLTFESGDEDSADTHPFADNDIILARQIDTDAATIIKQVFLIVSDINSGNPNQLDAVVQVTGLDSMGNTAAYAGATFVRIGNTGTASRMGGVYLTSDDSNAPFIDVWDGVDSVADWQASGTVKARLGKLDGMTSGSNEYGFFAGDGNSATSKYIVASDQGVSLQNIGLEMKDGSNTYFRAKGTAGNSYLSIGQLTSYDNNGIWLGNVSGTAKMSLKSGTNSLLWDGTNLTMTGSITAASGAIGGWTIASDKLSSSNIVLDDGNDRIDVGSGIKLYGGSTNGQIAVNTNVVVLKGTGASTIAGWNVDDEAIYRGTKVTSGNYAAAGDLTMGVESDGDAFISANQFRIDSDGSAFFKGTLEVTGMMTDLNYTFGGPFSSNAWIKG